MNTYYLRMEGVNLSNFVYDTQDLSTIRGGGLLLLEAVDRVKTQLVQLAAKDSVTEISTGASSGLFKFQAESGETVRKEIYTFLNNDLQLKHATFVVDVIEAGDEQDFAIKKEVLLAINRWRQMQSPSLAVPKFIGSSSQACETDLVRPASSQYKTSTSVWKRSQFGRDEKRGKLYSKLTGLPEENARFTNDLTELSSDDAQGTLNHKIAVIYADGNSFGKLQSGFDKKTLQRFDDEIKEKRKSFLAALIDEMDKDMKGWKAGDKYRIETLLWGGDEFMLVVPAWKGWEALQLFYEHSDKWSFDYQNEAGETISHKLTHSAGLVYCHHNAPIHRIKAIAHDLAEVCKDVEKEEFCEKPEEWSEHSPASKKGNYFAFQVLESFDNIHGGLTRYRQKICPTGVHHGALIVDGTKMSRIMDTIRTIKNDEKTSRGRLHGIVKDLVVTGKEKEAAQNIIKFTESTDSATQSSIEQLKTLFSGEKSRWLQLSELWDYVCPGRRS